MRSVARPTAQRSRRLLVALQKFVGDFGQLPVPKIERVADVDGDAVFRNKAVAYAFTSAAWAQGNIPVKWVISAFGRRSAMGEAMCPSAG